MPNTYYSIIKDFQQKLEKYTNEILKVYGNELQLRLEDYNLLAHNENCLESSTAFGFIIEEFLVSKLEIYSQNHSGKDYVIKRINGSTTASSYDCVSMVDKIKTLVNIKVEKKNNNAIAAIKKLHKDYVSDKPEQIKAYLVLKIHYYTDISKRDGEPKIFIDDVSSFYLEELDFSDGHMQDNRNWSKIFDANSGRLQASSAFRKNNKLSKQDISYESTKAIIDKIFEDNKANIRKV